MTMEGRIQCDYCVVGAGMIGSAAAKPLASFKSLIESRVGWTNGT